MGCVCCWWERSLVKPEPSRDALALVATFGNAFGMPGAPVIDEYGELFGIVGAGMPGDPRSVDGMPFRMPEKPDEIVGTGFKIVTRRILPDAGSAPDRGPPARRARLPAVPVLRRQRVVRAPVSAERRTRSAAASWWSRHSPSRRIGSAHAMGNRRSRGRREGQRAGEPDRCRGVCQLRSESRSAWDSSPGSGDPAMLIKSIQTAVRRVNSIRSSIAR